MSLSEKIANAESSDWLCKGMADEEVIKIISEAKKEARGRIKLIDTLDKIKAEIEKLNPVDYGSIYSYESHNGARDMKEDILDIIDKYKAESEDKE